MTRPSSTAFAQRGAETTRIEVFSDAAFACVVTLLVVSIDEIPASYNDLIEALTGVPAFAISFAIVFGFWYGHHQWSRRYGLDDGTTVVLSASLVFLMMVNVYPLKMMSNGMVFFFLGSTANGLQLDGAQQLHGLFIIFGPSAGY